MSAFADNPFQLILLLVGMSLLPFAAMVGTSYLKLTVVLALVRNALGIQSIPSNMVINALALILTFFIMAPHVQQAWDILQQPPESATPEAPIPMETLAAAAEPFRDFLRHHATERDRVFFTRTAERLWATPSSTPHVNPESFFILLPAFTVSELTRAFQIGFLIYLPFIVIDLIISNLLLAMGMMMVSPVTISLPFKLLLFVMVSGWTRLIQGLVQGYLQ
ncbi:MAG: type III secretion system export apparatus subunit SctR [Kiritimatiellae bacterium]|nr:type III secretion system export apparatus subunit SctR [Kiritimatiellia bacterium]